MTPGAILLTVFLPIRPSPEINFPGLFFSGSGLPPASFAESLARERQAKGVARSLHIHFSLF